MDDMFPSTLTNGETAENIATANEIDLEDIALTEEASTALYEKLKSVGIEPSQAFMETKAKWTDAGELFLFYTIQQSSEKDGQTVIMQIPADHWGVDIQQTYLH
jgi:hypothetical protein